MRQQLQSLTPLRGIAALWVVLYHYGVVYFPNLDSQNYTHILEKGYLAVDMFFMLSGFVMTHVYHRVLTENISENYLNFLLARVARLYPLHLVVLLLFVATALASRVTEYALTGVFETIPLDGPRSFAALIANLFMLQGLHASKLSWNYPAWSISVEFGAYLVFPFILFAIWRARPLSKLMLTLLLFSALTWLALLTRDDFNQWDGPRTLLRCLPEFMLGTIFYSAFKSGVCTTLLGRDAVVVSIVAGAILLLHLGAPDLLVVLVFTVLILAIVASSGKIAETINTKPLIWLGNISYSLYLIHGFVQYTATMLLQAYGIADPSKISSGSSMVLTLIMVAVSLVLASASYYVVETAGRRYLRAYFSVQSPSAIPQAKPPVSPLAWHSTRASRVGRRENCRWRLRRGSSTALPSRHKAMLPEREPEDSQRRPKARYRGRGTGRRLAIKSKLMVQRWQD